MDDQGVRVRDGVSGGEMGVLEDESTEEKTRLHCPSVDKGSKTKELLRTM